VLVVIGSRDKFCGNVHGQKDLAEAVSKGFTPSRGQIDLKLPETFETQGMKHESAFAKKSLPGTANRQRPRDKRNPNTAPDKCPMNETLDMKSWMDNMRTHGNNRYGTFSMPNNLTGSTSSRHSTSITKSANKQPEKPTVFWYVHASLSKDLITVKITTYKKLAATVQSDWIHIYMALPNAFSNFTPTLLRANVFNPICIPSACNNGPVTSLYEPWKVVNELKQ